MIYHYPLQWPIGWPRNERPEPSQFKVGYDQAVSDMADELERLGAESAYISTDMRLRMNGTPYRDRQPDTSGIAVYFVRKGAQLCIPCDKFNTCGDNIRAIGLTLEAIRRMERYGTSQMMEATLSGFAALPENATTTGIRSWHEVLGVLPDSSAAVIRAAYKDLAKKAHPDTGGSRVDWDELQQAYRESGAGE